MNIEESLKYIEISASSFLKKNEVAEISSQINAIRKKQSDANLYLAVIGEFSSGKSTFINALLGFRILKEAVTPTTACATYIRCKGHSLKIKVEFFTGSKFVVSTTQEFQKLAAYLHFHHNRTFYDLKSVIEALTSDQSIAKTVKSLYIDVPNTNIPSNIVIIDTPGFNPGANNVANHIEITKQIVEDIADAAIILTPQEQAMSSSLIKFLQNNIQHYLHRCIFVVTKMDVIDKDTREGILSYVKSRILHNLNIPTPKLFGGSAITMLPVKRIPTGKEQEWVSFQKDFSWFEHRVWSYLQKSKLEVLKEHVYYLIEDTITQCVIHLSKTQKDLEANKEFLEKHGIANIQSVCDKMLASARSSVNSSINNISISLSSAEYSSRSHAESVINEGVITLTNFKQIMMTKITDKAEKEARSSLSSINTKINDQVGNSFAKQIEIMSKVFSAHYDSFPSLRPKQTAPLSNILRFNSPNMSFSIAISKIDSLEQEENTATGVGAVIGGFLGFLVGGPIGAAVGAGVGAGGGIAAGDKSDEMRAAAIPLVKNEISNYFILLKSKIEQELDSICLSLSKALNAYADEHIKKYGAAVSELIKEHEGKILFLNKQIKSLNNTILNLQNMKDEINHEIALSKINN